MVSIVCTVIERLVRMDTKTKSRSFEANANSTDTQLRATDVADGWYPSKERRGNSRSFLRHFYKTSTLHLV
jgi:hypothetical protein